MRLKELEKDITDKEELRESPATEKMFFDNRIKRKNVLALNEKVAAIREYEKIPVYKRVGRKFHCSPDQIKRIIQQKDSILKAWEQRTRRCQDAKTLELKVVRVSMLGKAVYDWIRRMMYYKDFTISDGLIQKMALQFKSAMGLQNFFPHQEWCDKFRQTYKITELDSKQLKIGYAQGYSVQINDVMRDVLSECTPDIVEQVASDGEQQQRRGADEQDVKPARDQNANEMNAGQQATSTMSGNHAALPMGRAMPGLQPMRQLVALPIQSNGVGPQKVLVATPISGPAAQQRPGAPPMTMTIIPLATIGKTPNVVPLQSTAMTTAAAPPTAADKSQIVPPPILAIKQEIKEEPLDEIHIKQELVSDEEDDADLQRAAPTKTPTPSAASPAAAELAAAATTSDHDNLTLQHLRQLMQQINQGSNNAVTLGAASSVNTTTLTKLTKTTASGKSITPVVVVSPASLLASTSASIGAGAGRASATNNNNNNNKMAPLPPLPQLTRAPTALPSVAVCTNNNNNSNRRHHAKKRPHGSDSPQPPCNMAAIKSCAEARKYLKLLEDFALYKQNFRLIGLITRADELLRELDGDDDVDVD